MSTQEKSSVKILIAGPGTGKTTKAVKEFIGKHKNLDKILVLSYTNATIKDLLSSFKKKRVDITEKNCMTLHKCALKINHLKNVHILGEIEEKNLLYYAKKLNIDFDQLCSFLKCITFKKMITSCIDFIKTNPVYIREQIGGLELLIVDEYQDFNKDERELINLISSLAKEVVILGDDDQSIYEFKNADPQGIISLYKDSLNKIVQHENICHRCPKGVVQACNNLIINNKFRIKKTLKPAKKNNGIMYTPKTDLQETNQFIVGQIKKIKAKFPESTIMVISPFRFVLHSLPETLENAKIGYVDWFTGKTDLETMSRIWILRAIFGKNKLKDIIFLATTYLKKHSSKKKELFLKTFTKAFKEGYKDDTTIKKLLGLNVLDKELAKNIMEEPSFDKFFKDNPEFEEYKQHLILEPQRERNLEKLPFLMNEPLDFDKSKINLMSIHKSKGLQANYVFLVGLVNGILPNIRGIDSLEAQRRALYVAMSRTISGLYLISTIEWEGKFVHKVEKKKFKYDYKKKIYKGQCSPFVNELKLTH